MFLIIFVLFILLVPYWGGAAGAGAGGYYTKRGINVMYGGAFGGYTQWAVVFLIIFVLFFLLVPAWGGGYGEGAGAGTGGAY